MIKSMMESMMKPFEIHSANVLGARKPSLALRDTTDLVSIEIRGVSRLTLAVELCLRRSEKRGAFLYRLLTRVCARIRSCAFQLKERAY